MRPLSRTALGVSVKGGAPVITSCVKCGKQSEDDAPACVGCTWPFTLHAWRTTRFAIRRVTLDTGCINVKGADVDLSTLERWAHEGKITLERSDELLRELHGAARIAKAGALKPHPDVWRLGISRLGLDTLLAGPDMQEPIRETLFPTTASLSPNQQADVEHLRAHVFTGGDVFVTKNPRDFMRWGKQGVFSKLGIWVLSPSELVTLLEDLYHWS